MARLFTDGAELQNLLFWNGSLSGASNSAVDPRSGSRCYAFGNLHSAARNLVTPTTELYLRMAFRFLTTPPAGGNTVLQLRGGVSGTTVVGYLYLSNTLVLSVYASSGAPLITASVPIVLNQYYSIEVHFKCSDTVGEAEFKIDGASQGTFAGDTRTGTEEYINNIFATVPSTGAQFKLDDLAANDTTGAVDNAWCGDGKIVLLSPNGNGASSQFTGSDGNSTDNYALVDDLPPNSDTDYVADSVSGHKDDYALGTFTIPANHVVTRVVPIMVSREETAAGDAIQLGVISGATEDLSASIQQTTVYSQYEGNSYLVDPNTSAAWTQSGLDALKVAIAIP